MLISFHPKRRIALLKFFFMIDVLSQNDTVNVAWTLLCFICQQIRICRN